MTTDAEVKDGTETAAEETGNNQDQQDGNALEAAGSPATETATEKTGEQTEDEKKAEVEAKEAKEAEEREIKARENTPGTMEYYRKKAEKEKDARKKIAITIEKEREARIRAEERAKLLEEMATKKPEAVAKAPTSDGEPELVLPDMNDFRDEKEWKDATAKAIKDYNKAIVQHEISRGSKENEVRLKEAQAKTEQEKDAQERGRLVDSIISAGQKDYEDFDEVTHSDNLSLSPAMTSAILDLDLADAHHVEYHLGKNKAEQERIYALSPARQVMEIGRLSDKLRGARAVKPKESNAPPPIKPLKGGAQPSVDEGKLSDAEWLARRKAQQVA